MKLATGPARSDRPDDKLRDEAIQSGASDWIASRHFVALAMTSRSRDASLRPSYGKPLL